MCLPTSEAGTLIQGAARLPGKTTVADHTRLVAAIKATRHLALRAEATGRTRHLALPETAVAIAPHAHRAAAAVTAPLRAEAVGDHQAEAEEDHQVEEADDR